MLGIQFIGALELGLIYGIIALGVYLSFRVIDFPDLSVDGTFPLGSAIAAVSIVSGVNPWLATLYAFLGGLLAGSVTALLYTRGKILNLLCGILTMTGLYSVNLRVMGRPNIALLNETTIFPELGPAWPILIGFALVVLVALVWFMQTEWGLALRAVGYNARVSRTLGIHDNRMIWLALALSNGLVALAGALFTQSQGFADVTSGTGTVIIGLAAVIIGEAIVRTRKVSFALLACLLGSLIYYVVVSLALNAVNFGSKASDLKLISALIIVAALLASKKGASRG